MYSVHCTHLSSTPSSTSFSSYRMNPPLSSASSPLRNRLPSPPPTSRLVKDEPTPAYSVSFTKDSSRLVAGYNSELRIFDVEKPGRDCTTRKTNSRLPWQRLRYPIGLIVYKYVILFLAFLLICRCRGASRLHRLHLQVRNHPVKKVSCRAWTPPVLT